MKTWLPFARLGAATLALAAIVAQLAQTLSNAITADTPWGSHLPTVIVNFFSFFTVLSNLIAAVVLIIAAVWALRNRSAVTEPHWLATLLMCASTYMIVTGIVYNTLLRGYVLPQGTTVPWSNEVLHLVFPLFLLADVFLAPRRRPLPWSAVGVAAIFPVVWAAYTLLRANAVIAPASGEAWWYPYPFLNPHVQGGYGGVIAYIIGIAAVIVGVAALVVWAGRRRVPSDASERGRLTSAARSGG